MYLLERFALGASLLLTAVASATAADGPQFGKPVTQQDIATWDISIGPDGAGLPPGKGTVAVDGVMHDRPHLARAKRLLAQSKEAESG